MPELPGHKPLSLAQVALSQLATVALCLAPVIWTMAFSHPPSLPSFLPSSFLASENTPGPSCVVAQPPLPKTLTWRLSPGGFHLEALTWRPSKPGESGIHLENALCWVAVSRMPGQAVFLSKTVLELVLRCM